jgi:hypothetical protein
MPVNDLAIWLWLMIATELAVFLMLSEEYREPVKPVETIVFAEPPPVYLQRQIVPHLRARHPPAVIEAQLRWRRAAETHRRLRKAG